jgi:hypothetical protein
MGRDGIAYFQVRVLVVSQRQSRTINSLETFVPQGIPSEQDPELAKVGPSSPSASGRPGPRAVEGYPRLGEYGMHCGRS